MENWKSLLTAIIKGPVNGSMAHTTKENDAVITKR